MNMVHLSYSGLILSLVVLTIANCRADETEAACPSNGLAYLPHYGDCTKYYQCLMGNKTLMSCDEGFAWSIVISACDFKEYVDCSYTTALPTTTTTPKPTTTAPPGFQCPAATGISFHPNPYDCSKFIECINGEEFTLSCPDGYHFSAADLKCELAAYVDCSYTSVSPTATPLTTISPGFQCPATSGVSLHPYPYDCSKFIECIDGTQYIMNCPTGYHFSAADLKCELAAYVDCSYTSVSPGGSTTTPLMTTTTTTTTTPKPTTTTTTTTPKPTTADPSGFQCPAEEGISFHPHPYNCSKFIECISGKEFTLICPDGYHFSAADLKCELAAYVDCSYTSVSPGGSTTTPLTTTTSTTTTTPKPTTTTTTTTTPKPTTTTTTTTTTTPKPTTPKIPDDYCTGLPNGTYMPYPGDCKKFIECSHGIGTVIDCPANTAWDQSVLTCIHNTSNICP